MSATEFTAEGSIRVFDEFNLFVAEDPQMITFGEEINYYALVGKPNEAQYSTKRKPELLETYANLADMAIDLSQKLEDGFDSDKDPEFALQRDLAAEYDETMPFSEEELQAFEAKNCLALDDIVEAARVRVANRGETTPLPSLTIMNTDTEESKTVVLDAASLIASGELKLERTISKRHRAPEAHIETDILTGEYLIEQAAEIGIDAYESATELREDKGKYYYSSPGTLFNENSGIFGGTHPVSIDWVTKDGIAGNEEEHRHCLTNDLNYDPVDSYTAEDFLDAAQNSLETRLEEIGRNRTEASIALKPLLPLDVALQGLGQAIDLRTGGTGVLGYKAHSARGLFDHQFNRQFVIASPTNGKIDTVLDYDFGPINKSVRLPLQSATREYERLGAVPPKIGLARAKRLFMRTQVK